MPKTLVEIEREKKLKKEIMASLKEDRGSGSLSFEFQAGAHHLSCEGREKRGKGMARLHGGM